MPRGRKSIVPEPITVSEDSDLQNENDEVYPRGRTVTDHVRTAEDMINASRKRREAKRKAIEIEHKQAIEQLVAMSDSYYADRKAKIADIQAAQWAQLSTLFQSKRNIERQILDRVKSIDNLALNISLELMTILDGRLEEIEKCTKNGLPQVEDDKTANY